MALIGIIGAGLAGLSTAKILKSFGFDVVVFEKAADVGGVWSASRRYPGLTTQNPRTTYAFSDWPMPADYPEWPTGEQVHAYVESYVDHFDLRRDLRLSTEVTSAEPNDTGWTLKTLCEGVSGDVRVDYLIVCNGIFSIPAVPEWKGKDAFLAAGGRICHTSEFTDLAEAEGRDVLVVGYGKSSCDVANAIAEVSRSTTVIARSLIWKIPKKVGTSSTSSTCS